jgi:hypothetical protein
VFLFLLLYFLCLLYLNRRDISIFEQGLVTYEFLAALICLSYTCQNAVCGLMSVS